jgi:hypothetical protein
MRLGDRLRATQVQNSSDYEGLIISSQDIFRLLNIPK